MSYFSGAVDPEDYEEGYREGTSRKSRLKINLAIFIIVLGALSTTFAANISLNGGQRKEFGQGIFQIKAVINGSVLACRARRNQITPMSEQSSYTASTLASALDASLRLNYLRPEVLHRSISTLGLAKHLVLIPIPFSL